MKTKTIFALVLIMALGSFAYGQQLVYTPKNPAFGGDPFVGNWLLSTAQAQEKFEDSGLDIPELANLPGLDQSLTNQLASQVGGGDIQPGTSSFENFEIEVFENLDGLILNILNILNGEQTQIVIPNN